MVPQLLELNSICHHKEFAYPNGLPGSWIMWSHLFVSGLVHFASCHFVSSPQILEEKRLTGPTTQGTMLVVTDALILDVDHYEP